MTVYWKVNWKLFRNQYFLENTKCMIAMKGELENFNKMWENQHFWILEKYLYLKKFELYGYLWKAVQSKDSIYLIRSRFTLRSKKRSYNSSWMQQRFLKSDFSDKYQELHHGAPKKIAETKSFFLKMQFEKRPVKGNVENPYKLQRNKHMRMPNFSHIKKLEYGLLACCWKAV